MKKFAAILLSAATLFTGMAPVGASAAPAALSQQAQPAADANGNIQVADNRYLYGHRDHRFDRQFDRDAQRRYGGQRSYYRDRDYRRYDRDRYDRRYYRRDHHGNAGAIIGGLAAGAIIGGALSAGARRGDSHTEWCSNRYRSYRASDNTYQPTYGPRRQCVSP